MEALLVILLLTGVALGGSLFGVMLSFYLAIESNGERRSKPKGLTG